jgi:hypothetical protein
MEGSDGQRPQVSPVPAFAFCPRAFPAQLRLFRWATGGVVVTLAVVWLIELWNAIENSKVATAAPNVFDASIALGVVVPAILGAFLLVIERPGPRIVRASGEGLEAQFERWGSPGSTMFHWSSVRFSDIGAVPRVRAQSALRSLDFRVEPELFDLLRRMARAA